MEPRYCWRDFCERHSVDRNALAEVLGFRLSETDRLPPWLERAVRDARDLANQRRRRG